MLIILLNIVNSVGGFLLNQMVENGALAIGGPGGSASGS